MPRSPRSPRRSAAPSTVSATRFVLVFAAFLTPACSPAAAPPSGPSPSTELLFPAPATPTVELATSAASADPIASSGSALLAGEAPQSPCHADDDCGYDPGHARCGTDPRFNKQPAVIDQGLVCYCDAATSACALLRVEPAPCEGDSSCAVRLDPRPHPIRADADHPYEKPRLCRAPRPRQRGERDLSVSCERTNICTMHTRECARP